MYFRLDENRFFVPVSLIVPGSQIPFVKGGEKDKATLDIIGEVIDEVKRPIGSARETVKLNLESSLQARQKNIEYTTSFNLPPGKYHLKFVVRENQTGRMGSFEADIVLPDLKKQPLKMSSIVLASLRQPSKKSSPLVREGEEYVPNISHVFRQDQHLYLLYEVYGPTREKPAGNQPKGAKAGINLLSSLELLQGSNKVYQTPLVQAKTMNVQGRDAVAIELDVPLAGLKAGSYICQLNVVDDAGGSFAFPRFAVLIREPAAVTAPATQPISSGSGAGTGGHKSTQTPQHPCSANPRILKRRGRMNGGNSGRVAVITGATGGVGAAVARALSKAGYSLVLTAPSMEKLSVLASQLRGPCTVIEGSLGDESLPETLLYAALDRFGRCDVCFNNGALFEAGLIETVDIDRLSSMVRVNVEGSFRIAYVFLKHFVSEGNGHLVNVSSTVGSSSRPTAYAATQRAIEVLSDALMTELEDSPILVSCVQPGLVKTGLHHRWEIAPEGAAGSSYPLEPEDFARMVLFILEDPERRNRSEHADEPETAVEVEAEETGEADPEAAEETVGEGDTDTTKPEPDDSGEEGVIQDEI
jgi:NADP-dependent 3-hydroxy acid dehydrogenase YdfG